MNQQYWKECFNYDPETGILVWRVRPVSHFKAERDMNTFNNTWAHKRAGYDAKMCASSYVNIQRKMRKTHRIIWEMLNGPIPDGLQVDHINGNPFDNRLSNLRLATKAQNGRNTKPRAKSGHKGVFWDAARQKWMVGVTYNKKRVHIGRFDTMEEAVAAYQAFEKEHYGEFSYYARPTGVGKLSSPA